MELTIPKTISKELAEETGWHLGDGSMNYYKKRNLTKGLYQLRGHIKDDVIHYDIRIKTIFKSLYNLDINCHEQKSTGIYGFQIWDDSLINFKNKILNLPLGKKGEIKIPDVFLKESNLSKSVIRGIFDTDGCLYLEKRNGKLYPRIKISTTSVILSNQLKNEINKLGLRATKYTTKRNNVNWKPLQNIEIRGSKQTDKWFKIISPKNPKFIEKYQYFLNNS